MKLKNAKKQAKTKKQQKKQQKKVQNQQKTNFDEQEQQRDEALVDIKEDLIKKQQLKPKVNKRVQVSSKLQQTEIDTSKIVIDKKQEVKKISSWVVQQKDVKDLVKKDFKLHEVQHEFESLTDTKINEQLKNKKQKAIQQQQPQNVGQMKFAPLGGSNPIQSKGMPKLSLGKPNEVPSGIAFNTKNPVLNFTNSKLDENIKMAPIQKTPQQLRQQQLQRKMKQQAQQKKKLDAQINPAPKIGVAKGGWFKKSNQPVKQAPKVQMKFSSLNFTNSNLNTNTQTNNQPSFKGFQPIEKSKQQQIYDRKQQQFKFTSKKEQQQRKKKRQEEQMLKIKQKI